ncbi:MAG: DUF805 domain-containing protein [Akkermansia sp.]
MNTYTGYTLTTATQDFFKRYFNFSGRSTLSAYWYWILANILINIILSLIDVYVIGLTVSEVGLLSCLWGLITIIPHFALSVRRLHDIGKSGWNLLWVILPSVVMYASVIWLVVVIAMGGDGDMDMSSEELGEMVAANMSEMVVICISALVTMIGGILLFIYSLLDSKKGTNKWGPSEKYPEEA